MPHADPEKRRAYQQAYGKGWRERNRAAIRRTYRASYANRAARNAGVPGRLIGADLAHLETEPCAYCGAPGLETDHCTPTTRGGFNDTSNIVACCRACNASKGAKTVLEFLKLWP